MESSWAKNRGLGRAVNADLARLRALPFPADGRQLATTKATLARRMVAEGGYTDHGVETVRRCLSGNDVPRRPEACRAFFEALQRTMQLEFAAAGLAMETDYLSFTAYVSPKEATEKAATRASAVLEPSYVRTPQRALVLCVGAHPDDIELGAGLLVQRCIRQGYEVHFLVLTDEKGVAATRRSEAKEAAKVLGVPEDNVHFAQFRDGKLASGGPPVGTVRQLLKNAGLGLEPSFVVSHTNADSHADHRAANALVRAIFRKRVILRFSVYTSVERSSFAPRFFVEATDETEALKGKAISAYSSQQSRLDRGGSRADYERWLGGFGGLDRAEGFEIDIQNVEPNTVREVLRLSDAPFHRFWAPLLADGEPMYMLYETYLEDGQPASIERYSREEESDGRSALVDSFIDKWNLTMPVHERRGSLGKAVDLMRSSHVLLLGGAVSNNITATFFNRFADVDYVIECDQPGSEPVYLLQRSSGTRWFPGYLPSGELDFDVAVLSVLPNPYTASKVFVACAGVHGRGTQGLLMFLADPGSNPELLELVLARPTCNIPVRVRHSDLEVSVLPDYDTGANP